LNALRHALLLAAIPTFAGCNWISLAANALTYHTMQPGEAGNVAALDSIVYATRGSEGLAILDGRSEKTLASIAPPKGMESIDDVAIDGEFLFVLDAQPPGYVAVFSLRDPLHPDLVSPPQSSPVGPFSGVSAGAGTAMVSGGTSELTVWEYDANGQLRGPVATADLGRGQPDILLAPDGRAFVSTHYWGPNFGLEIVRHDSASRSVVRLGNLKLEGAGFTSGGAKPANFPIDMAMMGGDTLLIAFARGVAVVRVSDSFRPQLLRTLSTDGRAVNVDVQGNIAAVTVAGPDPSVVLIDFGRPVPLIRRIALPPGTNPAGVVFTGSRVAVAARERGVLLLLDQ
jgi:hypothetical protein